MRYIFTTLMIYLIFSGEALADSNFGYGSNCSSSVANSSISELVNSGNTTQAAKELIAILQDASQIGCWSNASNLISQLGPYANPILPELVDLMQGTGKRLSGPLLELQQAFAVSATPSLTSDNAVSALSSLITLLSNPNTPQDLKTLITSTLKGRFTRNDIAAYLKKVTGKNYSIPEREINNFMNQIQNVEARKWTELFNRKLQELNRTRVNLSN